MKVLFFLGYIPRISVCWIVLPETIPASPSYITTSLPPRNAFRALGMTKPSEVQHHTTWEPQDLTKDNPACLSIPDDDYIKKYQRNRELWPVEFFLIAYRRVKGKTQVLVRRSANGTSNWGVGTGVPATRWMLSTQVSPPPGYQRAEPLVTFEARNFPEFPRNEQSWSYHKINIREDAFHSPDTAAKLEDPELEEYANKIRSVLKTKLSEMIENEKHLDSWEASQISVVQNIVDKANSLAAIQGTLRMSGLFAKRNDVAGADGLRYIALDDMNAPRPVDLVESVRIYTMFPQMPDPMPLPSTPPEELTREIERRDSIMAKSGRDPHRDKHGRKFTHKSTSNVSNTIHGVYFTIDVSDLPGLDDVPAFDLFGKKRIKREWKSLDDLQVLSSDGKSIGTEDTKPTFISGFIVRQLVQEGVIGIHG